MMCHDILEYPWGCSWKLRDKEATTVICLLLKGPMLWIHKKTAFIQRPNVCKSRHGLLNSLVTLNWLRMFLDSVWLFWILVIWSLTLNDLVLPWALWCLKLSISRSAKYNACVLTKNVEKTLPILFRARHNQIHIFSCCD